MCNASQCDRHWLDGCVPHNCGAYLDDHAFIDGRFVCVPASEMDGA